MASSQASPAPAVPPPPARPPPTPWGKSHREAGGPGSIATRPAASSRRRTKQLERKKLTEWGECLSLMESDRQELEKERLRTFLADTQAERDQLKRRCSDLETFMRHGPAVPLMPGQIAGGSLPTTPGGLLDATSPAFWTSSSVAIAAGENEDLRKQLSAYCTEIEVLRKEKADLARELRDARAAVQLLTVEKSELLHALDSHRTVAGGGAQENLPSSDFSARSLALLTPEVRRAPLSAASLDANDAPAKCEAPPDVNDVLAKLEAEKSNLLQAIEDLQIDRKHLQDRCAELEELGAENERQRCMQAELEVAAASLEIAHDDRTRQRGRAEQAEKVAANHEAYAEQVAKVAADKEKKADVKEARAREMLEVVPALQHAFAVLQENFVAQTKEFAEIVAQLRAKYAEAADELEEVRTALEQHQQVSAITSHRLLEVQDHFIHCEARKAECATQAQEQEREQLLLQLEHEIRRREECERALESSSSAESRYKKKLEERNTRLLQAKNGCGIDRLWRALELNIAKEMSVILKGVMIDKVHFRSGNREKRFVAVSDHDMKLRWGKEPGHFSSGSCLDLFTVISITYGNMTRASVLHVDSQPWLCFSIYTTHRSFDFICPNEDTVRCFVLGISRLCDWAQGAIQTRKKFLAAKGWCKVASSCNYQKKKLTSAIMDVLSSTDVDELRQLKDKKRQQKPALLGTVDRLKQTQKK
eukprot:gnl/TRDRNA2_/TRDRNA2_135631_c0_seq1.p1 gnl/TRDRNA2_/TRDRNA2_135631_c0~~gnl/TRDRNA2_/TRDRNA2_135631_c0_seq1.p1  ORF type:complete len:805 (+),score=188.61 gnl/TRDRNA2_/TRDRNA2_135631_c0_seq1:296-2416(+)